MENQKPFVINEIVIGSFCYNEAKEKLLFYTTAGKLHAEITMSNKQYSSLVEKSSDVFGLWNALADLFSDKEEIPKRCPVCGRAPTIEYACGEYFVTGRDGCRFCGAFSEMHSLKNAEIKAWNEAADAESQFKCPLGRDETDDCADCAYSADYHFVNGECVRRQT